MITTLHPTTKLAEITIVCFFTRDWAIDRWIENFDKLEFPIAQTWVELVFVIDDDAPDVYRKLLDYLAGKPYNGVHIYRTGRRVHPETSVSGRRNRIVLNHEESKELIGNTKYVFGLEDDTVFPPDALVKMYAEAQKRPNLGYIEGVQCGRWNVKMIGGWRVDNLQEPTYIETVPWEPEGGIVEIDGGGFYCYLTPTELYKSAEYRWEHECFGPDVCYGLDLKRKGYEILLDYSIVCPHITLQGILRPNNYVVQAKYDRKQEDGFPEFWKMRTVVSEKEALNG